MQLVKHSTCTRMPSLYDSGLSRIACAKVVERASLHDRKDESGACRSSTRGRN